LLWGGGRGMFFLIYVKTPRVGRLLVVSGGGDLL